VQAVEVSIQNFLDRGEEIVRDNPDAAQQLTAVLAEVQTTGEVMVTASRQFVADPCSSERRAAMVKAARALLTAVTRLLVVADMLDVRALMRYVTDADGALDHVRAATNQQELNDRFARFRAAMDELNRQTGRRANDLRNVLDRDDLQAARAILKTNTPILYAASKSFIRHAECDVAGANRDYAVGEVQRALDAMRELIDGRRPADGHLALMHSRIGALMSELDRFAQQVRDDRCIRMGANYCPFLTVAL
jgi:catenin alpha